MPRPRHTQTERLPGVDMPRSRDLESRNAFGRVCKADYFNIDLDQFSDVTPVERDAISPERAITPRLYGMQGGWSVDSLSLNALEYVTIVRSPGAFTTAVAAKTEAARKIDTNVARRNTTVDRSIGHSFKSKSDRARSVIVGLEAEHTALSRLSKEIKTPGYAHVNEADMRILAETARTSFDNILEVVGHQAGWTPEQKVRATLAFNARLFDQDYRAALSFWREMTDVSALYTQRKIYLFQRRLKRLSAA